MKNSDSEKARTVKKRRRVIRSALIILYGLLLVLMIYTGRRHTILIDNKNSPDGLYRAIDGMTVSIDNGDPLEYYPGDRDKAVVQGQKHTLTIEIFDTGKVITRTFKIPLWTDMVLISVPKLVAGIEPWMEPFTPAEQIQETKEPDEPTGGEMFFSNPAMGNTEAENLP
jgi:hypothetical protein